MNVKEILTEDRAVSPVVGVALLIAITVILAAVIGAVVLGLGTSSADAPQASLSFEYDYDEGEDGNLTIIHQSGETLDADEVVLRGDGLNETGESPDEEEIALPEDLNAGQSEEVAAQDDQTVSVVWQDPNSDDESVIATVEIDDHEE